MPKQLRTGGVRARTISSVSFTSTEGSEPFKPTALPILATMLPADGERLACALAGTKRQFIISPVDGSFSIRVILSMDNGARAVFAGGAATVDWAASVVTSRSGCVSLSRTELRLFGALFEEKGRPANRNRLIELTWPMASSTDGANALSVYIHLIRQRLHQIGLPKALETVRGIGYRLAP